MDIFKLVDRLKKDFHFKSENLKMGYSEYTSELYDLTFIFGASNGDRYYLVKNGEIVLLQEDLSPFSKDDDAILYKEIYSLIRNFVRKKKIEKLI
jgi:hypothetical protein